MSRIFLNYLVCIDTNIPISKMPIQLDSNEMPNQFTSISSSVMNYNKLEKLVALELRKNSKNVYYFFQ